MDRGGQEKIEQVHDQSDKERPHVYREMKEDQEGEKQDEARIKGEGEKVFIVEANVNCCWWH